MVTKLNPFTPNSPAPKGMFIGRTFEIRTIDKALLQTKNSNPTHLLLLGERGIGKTSLLNVAQTFARGEFEWDDQKHNFLSVRLAIEENMNLADFAITLRTAIEREINKENKEIAWFKNAWDFLSKFEAMGVSYRRDESNANNIQLIQKFTYSLMDTIKALKDPKIITQKEGLVILLDEVDKAAEELHLGSLLKNISETAASEGCNNLLFILTGLPPVRDILIKSHESSLRLFQELNLPPLSKQETIEVIERGLKDHEEKTGQKITIDSEAHTALHTYSEGYPHFVQQLGYSVFEANEDNIISELDVKNGFFGAHGALETIGDRYYVKAFYKDINADSQREVLTIMSEDWNGFVTREKIRKSFSGDKDTLDNAVRALIKKGIILPKDGTKGQYRLQWASFAFWIKYHDRAKHRN